MATIRFQGVAHAYAEHRVLDDIDLELTEPRIGIIGANGSGKSTLARMLNGLVTPTSGRVTVDGLDTARAGAAVRRRVGFVFSDPDAQIVMPTVREDLEFSLRRTPRKERACRVDAALERFELTELAQHSAHLLSSGQKQRLALAAVLVTEPEVVVLDEPTTLLDLRHTRRFIRLVEGLTQQVVMVTHDLGLLAGWDRVIVIDRGRIAADGPTQASIAAYERLVQEAP